MKDVLYLNDTNINNSISKVTIDEVTNQCELAFKMIGDRKAHAPNKYSMILPKHSSECMNWINSMPCYIESHNNSCGVIGLKWAGICSDNKKKGIPSVNGTILLNDINTGVLFGILDAKTITSYRTASSVLISAKKFAPEKSKTMTLIGPGMEGRHSARFLNDHFELEKIYVLSRSNDSFESFKKDIKSYSKNTVKIERTYDVSKVIPNSDIVLASSTSTQPLITAKSFKGSKRKDQFVCGLSGFYDLSSDVLELADNIIFDEIDSSKKRIENATNMSFSNFNLKKEYSLSAFARLPKKSISGFNLYLPIGLAVMDILLANFLYHLNDTGLTGTLKAAC